MFGSATGRPSLSADLVGSVLVLQALYELSDGISVRRNYVGEYCTSLDMAGTSIPLSRLDDEIEGLLAARGDCHPDVLSPAAARDGSQGRWPLARAAAQAQPGADAENRSW